MNCFKFSSQTGGPSHCVLLTEWGGGRERGVGNSAEEEVQPKGQRERDKGGLEEGEDHYNVPNMRKILL